LLAELLKDTGVLFCQSFDCDAETLLAEVKRRQLEGIVAKRRGSLYRSGDRDGTWIKYKVHRQQEFIIGGYCPGNPMDSILVGYLDGSRLIFAGNVQAGFNRFSRVTVFETLQPLRQKDCPFANLPEKRKDRWGEGITVADMEKIVWLQPKVRVAIEFIEWTEGNRLRLPRFVRIGT
jgi:bifunctional non-homologous end joining protein LigD